MATPSLALMDTRPASERRSRGHPASESASQLVGGGPSQSSREPQPRTTGPSDGLLQDGRATIVC